MNYGITKKRIVSSNDTHTINISKEENEMIVNDALEIIETIKKNNPQYKSELASKDVIKYTLLGIYTREKYNGEYKEYVNKLKEYKF